MNSPKAFSNVGRVCPHLEEDDPVEDQSSSGADSEADNHLTHAGDHFVPN